MSKKTAIMRNSAMSESIKMSSLTQDMVRRMLHVSLLVSMDERIKVIDDFHDKLLRSGYSWSQCREIIVAGLQGYEKILAKVERGETQLHRDASDGAIARHRKKLLGPATWFKQKPRRVEEAETEKKSGRRRRKEDPATVLFVPKTPTLLHY